MPLPTEDELRRLEPGLYVDDDDAEQIVLFGKDEHTGHHLMMPMNPETAEMLAHELIVKAYVVRRRREQREMGQYGHNGSGNGGRTT